MTHLFPGVDAVLTDAPARPLRAVRLSAVGPLSGLIPASLSAGSCVLFSGRLLSLPS